MTKNNNNNSQLLIVVLIGIIVLLTIGCIFLFMKVENLYERGENTSNNNGYIDTPNTNYDNDDFNNNTNTNQNTNNYITKDEAIDIALKDIKLTRNDVYDLEVELERKYNATVYEVNFDYQYLDYEYYIDAVSGKILKSFSEID